MFGWNTWNWYSMLAGAALKSMVVLGAARLIAWILRSRSAAARHLVWTAAAAAVLAIPFLSAGLPALEVPGTGALAQQSALVFRTSATGASDAATSGVAVPAGPAARQQAASAAGWRPNALFWLALAWAAGSGLILLQMLAAYSRLWRARRAARPFADDGTATALARAMGIDREVAIRETAPGGMPMNFGVLHPTVFLPADAAAWTEERRRVVLLHELAHVRRGDVASHLLARAALALHWWNPLAWVAWREFLKERERAADDLVLSAGERASDYAGHLLEVARSLQASPATAWAAVAMARRSQLEGRLMAILDTNVNRNAASRVTPLAAALIAIASVIPLAALHAQDTSRAALPADVDATIRTANAQKNHEILENAAAGFQKVQNFGVAQTLLESALTIRGEVSGQTSPSYAAGLVKLGDLAVARRQTAEADAFYAKALSIGDSPETVPAMIYLGKKAFREKNTAQAQNLFERALAADPTGPKAGQATTWLGILQEDLVRFRAMASPNATDAAESLFQKALTLEGPDSADAANTMQFYAALLSRTGRTHEAAEMSERAREIIRKGLKNFKANATPGVYRVGSGVTAPALLYKMEPLYTEEARAAKYQGTVVLYVEIGPDGLAHNIQVANGIGLGLDEEAVAAVSLWKFKPGTKDGQPVTVAATIEVNFRLL
jgi:TonB family protein